MPGRISWVFKSFCYFILALSIGSSCVEPIQTHTAIPPGIWRAELNVEAGMDIIAAEIKGQSEMALEEVKKGRLPFNFEVRYLDEENFIVEILNGKERIEVTDIYFGKDPKTLIDTIRINFPAYDSYISGFYRENVIEGEWIVNYRPAYRIPFLAYHGQNHRFATVQKQAILDLTGKWDVQFAPGTKDEYPAIGEFVQTEHGKIEGTFRTETGDYRFLEGIVLEDKVFLSCFDGAHAFLFEAKILPDNSLIGSFQSGKHYGTNWIAVRNEEAQLKDPYALTYLKPEFDRLDFSLKNIEGGMLSLSDQKFQNKVKLVQLTASWCPNCRDESKFLKNYIQSNLSNELAIVSIGFEKYREEEKAIKRLKEYKSKMDIPWDFVYGGYADKTEASKVLPMLNRIISYPTLIFIDKKDRIRKIYTGFNGPATSAYDDFVVEFNSTIKELLAE